MKELRDAVNRAIKVAASMKEEFKEAINWGDLRCVNVEKYEDMAGHSGFRVLIEEASPNCPKFQLFIRQELKAMGFPGVDVRTEW